jgi:hypothetical protein
MSQDIKKHIGVGNILYYIYISNQGLLGNVVGRTMRDVERPQKDIMNVGNMNVLVGEN